ncbi:MAG: nuclear transport factor 2 family protein [Actinocrinis sp.]
MDTLLEVAGPPVSADLYLEVQQFYAWQMRLLDDGLTAQWAETFTADGVFDANGHPHPVQGRHKIAAGALQARNALDAADVRHRHWLGMLTVTHQDDGDLLARSYAIVFEIPLGGTASLKFSTVCEDLLVRVGGVLKVKDRQVIRDDLR